MITQCFNKCIVIDKNKTNNKYKIVIQQKQDADYITIKGHMSLTAEDVLTVKVR
jgi:lysyl-tRNA synthetase class II